MDRMDRSLRRHGQAMILIAALSGGVAGSALGLLASAQPATVVAAPARASRATPISTTVGRSATSSASSSEVAASSSASKRSETLRRPNRGGQAEHGKPAKGKGKKGEDGGHQGGHKRGDGDQ
jgi:hypothetical protein